MRRGSAGYVEPGALAVFGSCDSPVQLIEVFASAGERDPLTIWFRRGSGGIDVEHEVDVSNNVVWWP